MSQDLFLLLICEAALCVYSALPNVAQLMQRFFCSSLLAVWLFSVFPGITFAHNLGGNNHIGIRLHFLRILFTMCHITFPEDAECICLFLFYWASHSKMSASSSNTNLELKEIPCKLPKLYFGYFKLYSLVARKRHLYIGTKVWGSLFSCKLISNSYSITFK